MPKEPQLDFKFDTNSLGFRLVRSALDAIEAIFNTIKHKEKYILDADIAGCFDHIDHQALLQKLEVYPVIKQAIKAWLKAGVLIEGQYVPTEMGAPQGGVISPLLMNIALHGMETALQSAYTRKDGNILIVRYADDFEIFHPTEEGIQKAKEIIEKWLKNVGL